MAEPYKHTYKVDLNEPLKRFDVGEILASGDEKANSFEVTVLQDGKAVELAGCAVYGYFIRPNEETMKVGGAVTGNVVCVELSKSCYVYDGAFSFAIKVTGNGITQTVAVFDGLIVKTTSDNIVDGNRVIYGLEDLLAQIAATEAAANSANTAAGNAKTATARANQAAYAIEGITVSAEELDTGDATAELTIVEGKLHVHFGLPRGLKGDKGDPGTIENVTITSINGLPEALASVDAVKLGGKDPQYYLPALNLLDNSNFRKPINQRKASGSISTAGYFLDRWKLVEGSVTVGANGITLNGTIAQILEKAPGVSVTPCANAGTAAFDTGTNTFSLTGSGVLVTWAALYEGEYTAETLPPYVSNGYAVELAECQRYFVRIGGTDAYYHIGLAHAQSDTQLVCSVDVPRAMREGVAVAVVKGGEGKMTAKSGNVFRDISAVSLNQRGVSSQALTLTTANATTGHIYDVYVPSGSWLDISADL